MCVNIARTTAANGKIFSPYKRSYRWVMKRERETNALKLRATAHKWTRRVPFDEAAERVCARAYIYVVRIYIEEERIKLVSLTSEYKRTPS